MSDPAPLTEEKLAMLERLCLANVESGNYFVAPRTVLALLAEVRASRARAALYNRTTDPVAEEELERVMTSRGAALPVYGDLGLCPGVGSRPVEVGRELREGESMCIGPGYGKCPICHRAAEMDADGNVAAHEARLRTTSVPMGGAALQGGPSEHVNIEEIAGVEGNCLAVNNLRVAGPKPWGGGTVVRTWRAKVSDLLEAMRGGR